MRVALIHSSFSVRGGAERYVRDLAEGLAARGHEARVYCHGSAADGGGEPTDHLVARGVLSRLAGRVPRLRKILGHLGDLIDPTGLGPRDLGTFRPDVVHVHNWQGLGVLTMARLSRAYPTCHTVHDYAICDPNNTMANLGRSAMTDALLAARSRWIVARIRRCLLLWPSERTRGIVHDRVPSARRLADRTVPLAVPDRGGHGVLPGGHGVLPEGHGVLPEGHRATFLFLGALSPHKGVDLMLDAWRAARHETGDTLLVGGDGPLRGEVERLAAAMPSVRYLGYLDDAGKRAAMAEAGWLVFPSQWAENYPLSCVEALVAGRPIVSSTIASPPMASVESVLHFRDREELCAVFEKAARLPHDEYRAMASSAAADGGRLDWDGHVDAVVAGYGVAVTGHRGSRRGAGRGGSVR